MARIGDTYANAVLIHLEDWLWAGVDYDVRLVQFILRVDQLATRIEACSIEYIHNCLPNVQDWQDWMPMLCQSIFSCNASVNGSSIDTWTDRHAIICYFSAGLPLNWRIGTGLADWHRIGKGSAITEDICPFNLGTSVLYGMVPSLLGG